MSQSWAHYVSSARDFFGISVKRKLINAPSSRIKEINERKNCIQLQKVDSLPWIEPNMLGQIRILVLFFIQVLNHAIAENS